MGKPLKRDKKAFVIFRITCLVTVVALAVLFGVSSDGFTVQSVLNYTPSNYFLAALFILFLYLLKTSSFLFPIVVLYIASGTIFHPVIAILINFIGSSMCTVLPYFIGRYFDIGINDKVINKYPKIKALFDTQKNNEWFVSYFLRVISCLPADVVSLYLGAENVDFVKYYTGSMLGNLPGIILITLLGASVTNPRSPMFIISAVLTVLLSAVSVIIYILSNRNIRRKELG